MQYIEIDYFETFIIFLLIIHGIVLIFMFSLLFFQIKFICTNETTSENIKRPAKHINPFNLGFKNNLKEFFCNINGYKDLIMYSSQSMSFLKKNISTKKYFSDENFLERKSIHIALEDIIPKQNNNIQEVQTTKNENSINLDSSNITNEKFLV